MIVEGKSNDLLVQQARWRLIGAFVLLIIALILVLVLFDREPPRRLAGVQLHFDGSTSVVETSRREVTSRLDRGVIAPSLPKPLRPSDAATARPATQAPQKIDRSESVPAPTQSQPPIQDTPPPQAILSRIVDDDQVEPDDPTSLSSAHPNEHANQTKNRTKPEKTRPKTPVMAENAPSPQKPAQNTPVTSQRFVVRIGHFSDKSLAQQWAQKLNNQGVPTFIEQKRLADGHRILLRAGPFNNSVQAEKAAKTAKNIGLLNAIVVGS